MPFMILLLRAAGGSRGGGRGFATAWASLPAVMRAGKHVLLLGAVLGGGLP